MRKTLIASVLAFAMIAPTFAEYSMTTTEKALVQSVIEKVQKQPLRVQESMIMALKNGVNKTSVNDRKKVIFAAIETGLRKKTTINGETAVLATQLERTQIKKTLVTKNIYQKDGSVTLDISGQLSSTIEPKEVNFEAHMAADVDMHDLKNPKVRLTIDASGSADAENMSGVAELRVVDSFGFFKFANLVSTSPDIQSELGALQPFLNIWWKVPLSESDLADIANTEELTTQNNKTMEKILLSTNIIPVLQYMGQEKGVSTYGGLIDNKAVFSLIKEAALSEWETVSDQDMIEAEKMFNNVSLFTKFSLTDKNIFTAFSVVASISPTMIEPGNTVEGNINVDMTISPLKSPIVAPENAREFDEKALMGM